MTGRVTRELRWAAFAAGAGIGLCLLALGLAGERPVLQSNLLFIGYILIVFGISVAAMSLISRNWRR